MKYIILILWTFSLFLLMFSSFPFRVECRPTRAMGPGPPYIPGTGVLTSPQFSSSSSVTALSIRGSGRLGISNCPVLEGPSAARYNPWPELYVTDITVKAWDTSLVLEGMARSRSEVRSDGTYGVTFDLIRVVKGDAPLLRRRKQFRLQFLDNPSPPTGNQSEPANTATTSTSGGSTILSKSSSSSNNVNSNHHNHNYNRALGLRSNSNSNNNNNNQRNSQLSSSSARVSSSGTISLKSSNLHSNYVNLHNSQQQLARRGYSSSSSASPSSSTSMSSSSRVRNNPSLSQTVQFNQQYVRNYHTSTNQHNFTAASGSRSKNLRIARSHQQQQLQQYTGGGHNTNYDNSRHARHGRVVVGPHNNIVNSASTSGGVSGTGKCLPPRATVKTGRKYFVFAAKVENHFVAVFSPELANKRNTKAVESILCKGCGQAPSVVAAKEVVLQPKERLRIRCRLRAGNPIPVLTWYKDGRLVNLTDPRYRLRAKRRQSVLVIRKAKEMDTGVYKCEAKNVFGSAHATTRVSISQQPQKPIKPPSPKPVGTTPTTLWAVPSSVCPFDSYCLNGGTCSYYETIGEYVCQCAEGYKGQRCDTKDIPNSGSYLSYFCIFGTNNPDYPC